MKKLGALIAVLAVLTGAAVATPSAGAQVASAAVAVVFSNVNGTSVSCPMPEETGAYRRPCHLSASASGATVPANFCEETFSVSVGPAHANAGRLGCSVSVDADLFTEIQTLEVEEDESFVHSCTGAGIGTATYSPAPGSAAAPMEGIVAVSWTAGVVTINGLMSNLGPIQAGEITAVGFDLCGTDLDPNPFDGEIN